MAITAAWSKKARCEPRSPNFAISSNRLVAASLIDLLDDGISAVYSFYDPRQAKRSLGTWSILWLVEECRRRARPYVYLGYWIAESPKMAYKARFPALERLTAGGWTDFASPSLPREADHPLALPGLDPGIAGRGLG